MNEFKAVLNSFTFLHKEVHAVTPVLRIPFGGERRRSGWRGLAACCTVAHHRMNLAPGPGWDTPDLNQLKLVPGFSFYFRVEDDKDRIRSFIVLCWNINSIEAL